MFNKNKLIVSATILSVFFPFLAQAQTYYGGTLKQNPNVYHGGNNTQNNSFGGGYKEQYSFNQQQQPTIKSQMTQTNPAKTKTASVSQSTPIFYQKGSQPCWDQAAQYHKVDPWVLYSIAYVESRFNPHATNTNKNGSTDIGMMQINTIWLPKLKKMGIEKEMLKDACTSTYIGAWILSQNIKRFGNTWRAIGAYNSATPKIGYKYATKVYAAHHKFTGQTAKAW